LETDFVTVSSTPPKIRVTLIEIMEKAKSDGFDLDRMLRNLRNID
jgi:hypothetical protein